MSKGSYRSTLSQRVQTAESINFGFLDDLSDKDLVLAVEKAHDYTRHLDVENDVWLSFLQRSEPRLVRDMDRILHYASVVAPSSLIPRLRSQVSIQPATGTVDSQITKQESLSSIQSQQSVLSRHHSSAIGSWISGPPPGQRVNLSMKIELARRERELNEATMKEFLEKSRIRRQELRCRLEELALQLSETREARSLLDQLIATPDERSRRLPAERYMRYLEDWLRSADQITEKLRLRTSTLHYRLTALTHQLSQKEELGESLHPVDFDQVRIENRLLQGRIDSKNSDLLQLKQRVGAANLQLARRRRHLLLRMAERTRSRTNIAELVAKRRDIAREQGAVAAEVSRTDEALIRTRRLIEQYTVPDLLDYVRVKKELADLARSTKVWSRRNHLQQIALASCVKTMKGLTATREEHSSWFSYHTHTSEDDDSLGPSIVPTAKM